MKQISFHAVNPCDNEPCENGGTCESQGDSYTCKCVKPYSGKDCTEIVCEAGYELKNGQCVFKGI